MSNESLEKRLSNIFFKYKDIIEQNNTFKLNIFTKNMVTKIHSNKHTWLFYVSDFDNKKLLEIVIAGLSSINKKIITEESFDITNVDEITEFLNSSYNIFISLENDGIFLVTFKKSLKIISINDLDKVANQMLVRSLGIFLAICGKNVSSNIDSISLNDYGSSGSLFEIIKCP